jgi:hypothetical protein
MASMAEGVNRRFLRTGSVSRHLGSVEARLAPSAVATTSSVWAAPGCDPVCRSASWRQPQHRSGHQPSFEPAPGSFALRADRIAASMPADIAWSALSLA